MTWIQTYSGEEWSLDDPCPDRIQSMDIARSLSNLCRFNGHCGQFYSVAEHCCRVARALPNALAPYGLLHDAHEAWIGDIASPVKDAIGRERIAELARRIDFAIYEIARVRPPNAAELAMVKEADLRMLATERRDLMLQCVTGADWPQLIEVKPFPETIRPVSPAAARGQWLHMCNHWRLWAPR